MDSKGKVLISVVAGAVAGATVALLFAPAKGSETREKIMQLGRRKKDSGTVPGKSTIPVKSAASLEGDLIAKGKSPAVDEENLNVW